MRLSGNVTWRERAPQAAAALTAVLLVLSSAAATAVAQERRVPDTFTAMTTDMTPSGVTLRFDVLEWSDDAARAAVISALTGDADVSAALKELPTIGYVWPSGSPVGYAIKYAHRMTASGGGERITFVTDKPVGTYSLKPWAANDRPDPETLGYSVIDLYPNDGNGVGTMSLAADVAFDHESNTVSLADGDASNVLAGVKLEPKPYWAQGS